MEFRKAKLDDIPQIISLEKKYHKASIKEEDKADGYVTTFFSEKNLKILIEEEEIAIACHKKRLVAYAVAASWKFWSRWQVFQPMIDDLPNIKYLNTVLSKNNSYQYGPVCIDKDYRGTKVLPKLFEFSRLQMKDKFPILITYIDQKNIRSYQAHSRKLGLDVVKEFEFHGNKLYVLCYDTSKEITI